MLAQVGEHLGPIAVTCREAQELAVVAVDVAVFGPAEPRGGLDDRVEHRLEIERAAADHLKDVAGCSLPLESAGQVAVARLELGEEPHVLDRDHRLVGEGPQQRNLCVREEPDLGAPYADRADRAAIPEQRHAKHGPRADPRPRGRRILWVVHEIRRLDHAALERGASRHRVRTYPAGVGRRKRGALLLRQAVGCRDAQRFAVEKVDAAERRVTQQPGAPHDAFEHGLHVRRRPADHAQDLARRRLPSERLGELAIARLELGEEPHVLDRDHRLVGERPQEGDVILGKRAGLGASDGDGADRASLAHERHRQDAAEVPSERPGGRREFRVQDDVGDLDHAAGQDRPGGRHLAARRSRPEPADGICTRGRQVHERGQVDQRTVVGEDVGRAGSAQFQRGRGDRVEHRLHVGARPADDAQDLARRRELVARLRERVLRCSGVAARGRRGRAPPGTGPFCWLAACRHRPPRRRRCAARAAGNWARRRYPVASDGSRTAGDGARSGNACRATTSERKARA